MRTGIYTLLFCCACSSAYPQSDDIGKIALAVVMPEKVEGLDPAGLSKLESKVTQIVSGSGIGASGLNNNFVIYPKVAINESNTVEGGMQNITVMSIELSLYIKQVENNLVFASVAKTLKGTGTSKPQALSNAISKLSASDPEFSKFISEGKNKIIDYYEKNCESLIKKAETFASQKQYDQALGLLMTVPEEISGCYDMVQEKAIEAFKRYQNQICSELIQQAKAKIAANANSEALDILAKIDPSADCIRESQALVSKIESKISEQEKKEWDAQMMKYKNEVELEKLRINAVKEIAVSYYRNQPKTVNYLYITR